jgi:hypothetical protein
VSAGDADLLASAFNIKTVRDLGRNKFFQTATALVDLEDGASRTRPRRSTGGQHVTPAGLRPAGPSPYRW